MKYKVIRNRKCQPLPAVWNGEYQTSEENRLIHGSVLKKIFQFYENGNLVQFYDEDDWDLVAEKTKNRIVEDASYVSEVFKKQLDAGEKLADVANEYRGTDLSKFTTEELIKLLEELNRDNNTFNSYNVTPWFIGGDKVHEYIESAVRRLGEFSLDKFQSLISPDVLSFSGDEERMQLEIAFEIRKQNFSYDRLPEEILQRVNILVQKYAWIPFGYDGPDLNDQAFYLNAIQKLVHDFSADEIMLKLEAISAYSQKMHEKHLALKVELKIDEELWRLIQDYHKIVLMTDQRKEFTFQSHVLIDRVLQELANKNNVGKINLKYLTVDEIKEFSGNVEKMVEVAEKRINNPLMFIGENGKAKVVEGDEVEGFKKDIFSEDEESEELKGMIGCLGTGEIVTGPVKVILSPSEMSKMEKDDILVAPMTSPEYVPVMRMAKAIITDEGGVTCHAAIVSRELHIPCIIATRNATKVLKDGDIVEVDTSNGLVRIIKS